MFQPLVYVFDADHRKHFESVCLLHMCIIDISPSSIHTGRPFILLSKHLVSPRYGRPRIVHQTQSLFEFTSSRIHNGSLNTSHPLQPLSIPYFLFPTSTLYVKPSMPRVFTLASVAAFAALASYVAPSIRHELKVLGVGRDISTSTIANAANYVKIADTTHCEDLHYYAPANLLFTACEDRHTRFGWFPPLGSFEPPKEGTKGSIHVVDPEVSFCPLSSTVLSRIGRDRVG